MMANGNRRVETADCASLAVWDDESRNEEKPALLLVSGLGGAAAFWSAIVPDLSHSFRVICFDQRGIGASTRGEAVCTIDLLAQDCLAVLDALQVERAIFVGHSTGGCIGQSLARQAPARLAGLVLSATWLKPNRYMQALFSTRRVLLDHDPKAYAASGSLLGFSPLWLETHWDVYESMVARPPATAKERRVVSERIEALLAFDGLSALAAITMPTLILGVEDDMIVPAFLQRELAAALPNAQLVMLNDGGHFYPVSRPGDFVSHVKTWWRRHSET